MGRKSSNKAPKPDRVKGNLKPASKSRATETLNLLGKKILPNPFDWSVESTIEDSIDESIEHSIEGLVKSLTKKDNTTRLKAMRGLYELGTAGETKGMFWKMYSGIIESVFKSMADDIVPAIRELNQRLFNTFTREFRTEACKMACRLAGYLYCSLFDESRLVREQTQETFQTLFDKTGSTISESQLLDKHCKMIEHTWTEISRHVQLVTEKEFVDGSEGSESRERMICVRLNLVCFLMKLVEKHRVSPEMRMRIVDLAKLFLNGGFLLFVLKSDVRVKRLFYILVQLVSGYGYDESVVRCVLEERNGEVLYETCQAIVLLFEHGKGIGKNMDMFGQWITYWQDKESMVLEYVCPILRTMSRSEQMLIRSKMVEYVWGFSKLGSSKDVQTKIARTFCDVLELTCEKDELFEMLLDQIGRIEDVTQICVLLMFGYTHISDQDKIGILLGINRDMIEKNHGQDGELAEVLVSGLKQASDQGKNVVDGLLRKWWIENKTGKHPVKSTRELIQFASVEMIRSILGVVLDDMDSPGEDGCGELVMGLCEMGSMDGMDMLKRRMGECPEKMEWWIRLLVPMCRDGSREIFRGLECLYVFDLLERGYLDNVDDGDLAVFFGWWIRCSERKDLILERVHSMFLKGHLNPLVMRLFCSYVENNVMDERAAEIMAMGLSIEHGQESGDTLDLFVRCSLDQQRLVISSMASMEQTDEESRMANYLLIVHLLDASRIGDEARREMGMEWIMGLGDVVSGHERRMGKSLARYFLREGIDHCIDVDLDESDMEEKIRVDDSLVWTGILFMFESGMYLSVDWKKHVNVCLNMCRMETVMTTMRWENVDFGMERMFQRVKTMTRWICDMMFKSRQIDDIVLLPGKLMTEQMEEAMEGMDGDVVEFGAGLQKYWTLNRYLTEFCRSHRIGVLFPFDCVDMDENELKLVLRSWSLIVNVPTEQKCKDMLSRVSERLRDRELAMNRVRLLSVLYVQILAHISGETDESTILWMCEHSDMFVKGCGIYRLGVASQKGIRVSIDFEEWWSFMAIHRCLEIGRGLEIECDWTRMGDSGIDGMRLYALWNEDCGFEQVKNIVVFVEKQGWEFDLVLRMREFWRWLGELDLNVEGCEVLRRDAFGRFLFWYIIVDVLGENPGKMEDVSRMLREECCERMNEIVDMMPDERIVGGFSVEQFVFEDKTLWSHVYERLLMLVPDIVRAWWKTRPDKRLERVTRDYFSRAVIEREVARIREQGEDLRPMQIQVVWSEECSLVCMFPVEDTHVEMTLVFPKTYPLRSVVFRPGRRIGVSRGIWDSMCRYSGILFSTARSVGEALMRWKENTAAKFQGVEECPICYFVLHMANRGFPGFVCRTCRHSFHAACLYKWFKTSGDSTCPLCRSAM